MPILLTTPYDPGHADPGKLYTHVKISEMIHYTESRAIRIVLNRGYVENGAYVIGKYFPPVPPIVIRDHIDTTVNPETEDTVSVTHNDYSNIVSAQTNPLNGPEYIYNLVSNELYKYIVDNVDGFQGTVV